MQQTAHQPSDQARRRALRTEARMARIIRTRMQEAGAVERRDLVSEGFTQTEIDRHADAAYSRAAQDSGFGS